MAPKGENGGKKYSQRSHIFLSKFRRSRWAGVEGNKNEEARSGQSKWLGQATFHCKIYDISSNLEMNAFSPQIKN